MDIKLFNYQLPPELIAQTPSAPRDHSRLMVLNQINQSWQHDYFYNLPKHLDDNCVLVFNNSKVIPARLKMQKETGGKVEIFLLNKINNSTWGVMVGGKVKANDQLQIINNKSVQNFKCQILNKLENGNWQVKFNFTGKRFQEIINKIGETPLPPYIKIKDSKKIRARYQTTFAKIDGSVAAPTAGLHFTKRLLKKLKAQGVKTEFVTLHVGLGTFKPVKATDITQHQIHTELAMIDRATAKRLNVYRQQGKKIIAVGTTACRTLEAFSDLRGQLKPGSRWVNIYIYPGYKFKFIQGLITNFHLPKSTLLMLVSALSGRKFILDAYLEAIKQKYRFFSFGDGMFIT